MRSSAAVNDVAVCSTLSETAVVVVAAAQIGADAEGASSSLGAGSGSTGVEVACDVASCGADCGTVAAVVVVVVARGFFGVWAVEDVAGGAPDSGVANGDFTGDVDRRG